MPGPTELLVFSHDPQVTCWAPMARGVARRLGAQVVAWVIGPRDQQLAEETGCYARVVDLLAGLDPARARSDLQRNLERVRRHEQRVGAHCFHEDVAIDRHVMRTGWGLPRVYHLAAHVLRAMDRQVERHGLPLAALGEANTLPYRLAYRTLRPHVYYCYSTVERSWSGRFYVDVSISALRPRCGRAYERFMDRGVPPELERLAAERLAEFRQRSLIPVYSRATYAAGATRRGTEPLRAKLTPRQAAGTASRWVRRLLKGDYVDPRLSDVRSPLTGLIKTGVERSRKAVFHQLARAPARDGVAYCAYFLHTEPEYSVEGLAFDFRDQLATIQSIAAMLPGHMRLYVKEHRPMLGLRPQGFYRTLRRIPNVLLLTDDVLSHEIILGAQAVFTLTGTPGLEAMLYGVPAVVLGSIYFQSFAGVYPVRSPDQLRATIRQVLGRADAGADDRSAIAALAALHATSYPGKDMAGYPVQEVSEPQNVELLVAGLTDTLRSHGVGG